MHVDGSNCSDRLTTVGLTGTVSGNDVSLTSTSVAGQFTTLSGRSNGDSFAGTYTVKGDCADGDQGRVTGSRILQISNGFTGTFTASGGQTFDVAGNVAQDNRASSEGSFGLSGTVSFRTSHETLGVHFAAVGTSSALRVRGIPWGWGIPRINRGRNRRVNFTSAIFRPERRGQLAIQYNMRGGDAPCNDCWWD